MKDDEKIERLREYYASRTDGVARKVLDSFAKKVNWRSSSLVHRIVQETQLSEREVRSFLKDKLQDELELGKYKKGAQGYKSRFEWAVEAPCEYSLVSVGLAAQGKSTSLHGDADAPLSEDDDEGDIIEESIKIGRDRFFKAEFPNDLTPREFDHFVASFKVIYFP